MSREAFCQLTAGDLNILMSMLDETGHTEAFTILLREKLNYASVFFREDIPENIVTLDTQVAYTVNGVCCGPHVVVRSTASRPADSAISVRTMRGLALLGLAVGERTEILGEDGWPEILAVERIVLQPESEARLKHTGNESVQLIDHAPQVVNFRPRPRKAAIPHDDDPGPTAA
ncbi:transcription elongation factor GreAB [Sinorhizobium sp. P24N7]|uniref:transcription elongation factor GreAB n=1 Tax=Sinorhizobium sp. P24N7 TaxID=3348358 RepID=UPI0036D2D02D